VNVDFSNGIFSVQKSKIKAFEFDATHCPDLFPPMAVLAAYADGVSRIFGVERLYQKESNRALALQAEFKKQGIQIELNGNEMLVHGGEVNGGASFNSYHDHRMAMAGAILALKAEQSIKIEGQECVSKSYPDFFKDLESLL
jgi:3-phosphoshikimate 1-carboxyvinyltransferase